jgi:hypothetical protein
LWAAAGCLALPLSGATAQAKDLKFQALLVWATDAETSPEHSHKPVDAEVLRKLKDLPLRWKNFYEVKRQSLSLAPGGSTHATLSDQCRIRLSDIDGKHVEISLIGKGEPVLKRTQPLTKGEMLVVGGNAPNATGWLVVVKRVE